MNVSQVPEPLEPHPLDVAIAANDHYAIVAWLRQNVSADALRAAHPGHNAHDWNEHPGSPVDGRTQ